MNENEKRFVEMLRNGYGDTKELALLIDTISNNFSFAYREVADELKFAPAMQDLSIAWIVFWKEFPTIEYERNTLAMGAIKRIAPEITLAQIADQRRLQAFLKMMEEPYTKYGSTIRNLHRTLMQTFTKYILYYMNESEAFIKVAEEETGRGGSHWYSLPMI